MARLTNAELAYMKLRVKEIRDSAIRRLEITYTKKGEASSDAAKLNAIIDMKVLRKKYGKALDVIVLKDREEANSAFGAFKLKYEE